MAEENQIIVPFLKWAGGKRWLASSSPQLFPERFDRYVEPFLGSGAVFFYLQPSVALLADRNCELVETYQAIRADWKRVVRKLRQHHQNHSRKYYYRVRQSRPRTNFSRAARFIYLNRTCWNGLFRVNRNGEFNVPIGSKTNVLLESDNFQQVACRLKHTTLVSADFEDVIDKTKEGDFIFIDPPYTVKHNHNGFIKYNEKIFSWEDQERLYYSLVRADRRGARFLVSNADHKSIRDLYKPFFFERIERHSKLAADARYRVAITELFIKNYEGEQWQEGVES